MPTPNPTDPLAALSVPRADQQMLTDTPDIVGGGYAGMNKAMAGLAKTPGLTETILPSIKALLMPGEDNPYAKLINASTQANKAEAQTRMMSRGLTGSDIEESAIQGAAGQGEMAKSQFYADNAKTMAGFIKELATGDINAQRENLVMFAQLMGQKIQSDQDLMMFREQLSAGMDQAAANRRSSLWGAGIGAVGAIGMGALLASDARLKSHARVLETVDGIDIVRFGWLPWTGFKGEDVGVIAQQVEKVRPDLVENRGVFKMVRYGKLPKRVKEAVLRHANA